MSDWRDTTWEEVGPHPANVGRRSWWPSNVDLPPAMHLDIPIEVLRETMTNRFYTRNQMLAYGSKRADEAAARATARCESMHDLSTEASA